MIIIIFVGIIALLYSIWCYTYLNQLNGYKIEDNIILNFLPLVSTCLTHVCRSSIIKVIFSFSRSANSSFTLFLQFQILVTSASINDCTCADVWTESTICFAISLPILLISMISSPREQCLFLNIFKEVDYKHII